MSTGTKQSQTMRAVLGLRGMIIDGHLKPGERIIEHTLVDELGVSRTPARIALIRVHQEGLLEKLPGGGYGVTRFSEDDIFDAIAIRGTIEGLAARKAAERSAPPHVLKELRQCVADLDEIVLKFEQHNDVSDYVKLNDRFHELVLEAAQSPMISRTHKRHLALPFAAPNAFVTLPESDPAAMHSLLIVAQEQHRGVLEAIEHREGARAEALMREHSRCAWRFLRSIFHPGDASQRLPSIKLAMRDHIV